MTGEWEFYSASAHASEVNGFTEAADGSLQLMPGRNDGWKTAHGRLFPDWKVQLTYGSELKAVPMTCELSRNCSFIRCPAYVYSRLNHSLV